MIQITAYNNEDEPVVVTYKGRIVLENHGKMLFVSYGRISEDEELSEHGSDFFYMEDISEIVGKEG